MKRPPRRIMIVHPVGDPQQMPFLRGISDYARKHGRWALQFNPELLGPALRHLARWRGDGVIAAIRTPAEVRAARQIHLPIVNLAGWIEHTGIPRVMVDQEAMGRMAAEHLLARGLGHFAYYGERTMWYSQLRRRGFQQRLAAAGHRVSIFETSTEFGPRTPWYKWTERIEKWIQRLARPVGLLAVHDYAGTVVIDACLRNGLRVPEDVAVVGIGDDSITCEFCEVPLSSVARANREVGYEAAALLERLMDGQPAPNGEILVPPEGVVARRSTDVRFARDPVVAAALTFIHDHVEQSYEVEDVWLAAGVSRRTLELHFQAHLGCTPRDYIARLRNDRAKALLGDEEGWKLQRIARSCGFRTARHLRDVFHRLTGVTPQEHRRRAREDAAAPAQPAATRKKRPKAKRSSGRSKKG